MALPLLQYWIVSYLIYTLGPTIAKAAVGYSAWEGFASISSRTLEAQIFATILFGACFTISYLQIRRTGSFRKLFDGDARRISLTSLNQLLTVLGLILVANSLLATAFDVHDRYNDLTFSSPIVKTINSLAVGSIATNLYFFLLGRGAASWPKISPRLTIIFVNSTLILVSLIKTGSRSLLFSAVLSLLIGSSLGWRENKKHLAKIVTIYMVLLVLHVPVSETLRIARSYSSFFKTNPIEAVRAIASSTTWNVSPRDFIIRNRRDELSEIVFTSKEYCQNLLSSAGNSIGRAGKKSLLDCVRHSEASIGFKYLKIPGIRHDSLSRVNQELNAEIDTRHETLRLKGGLNRQSVSRGEKINMIADYYQRWGFLGVGLMASLMGFCYCLAELLLCVVVRNVDFYSGLVIGGLPLILLTGNLSFPLEQQIWLAFVQLPKLIVLSYLLGRVLKHFIPKRTYQSSSVEDKSVLLF